MEPIRRYFTREGWKADWEQTKKDVSRIINYFRTDKQSLSSSDKSSKYSCTGVEEYNEPISLERILDNPYNENPDNY